MKEEILENTLSSWIKQNCKEILLETPKVIPSKVDLSILHIHAALKEFIYSPTYKIIYHPSEYLSTPSIPLNFKLSRVYDLDLLKNKLRLICKENNASGIAIAQLGINVNIFYLRPKDKLYINSKITKKYGNKSIEKEGCISIPGIKIDVKRYNNIQLLYKNSHGSILEEQHTTLSRLILHEVDHCKGITILKYKKDIVKE